MAEILTIIPYQFYPPISGGALRCFYILREMCRHHQVTLLTVQTVADFKKKTEFEFPANVKVINLFEKSKYRTAFNKLSKRFGDAVNYRYLKRSLFTETNSFILDVYPTVKDTIQRYKFDIVYYENLEVLGLLQPLIKRKSPSSLHIYDAHNCDSDLWYKQALKEKKKVLFKYAQKAKSVEEALYKKTDAFFCCSREDNEKLTVLNRNGISGAVIPNGVNITDKPFDTTDRKYINPELIFCGSLDYYPNLEGLQWFYEEVFPILRSSLPSITLTIIGNLTQPEKYRFLEGDSSVSLIGKVESVLPYYKKAAISIVPLKSGSGTRLKILEAMSLGNPVVSTSIGAEGIEFESGRHMLIADDTNKFAKKILLILTDNLLFKSLREDARKLVETKYDWRTIGIKINENIERLLEKSNGRNGL